MEIKEEGILEFKALTMTRRTFKQLRSLKSSEGVEVIGWVNDEGFEHFIGRLGQHLVSVPRMALFDRYAGQRKELEAEAQRLKIGLTTLINSRLDEYRDSLPQIFLK